MESKRVQCLILCFLFIFVNCDISKKEESDDYLSILKEVASEALRASFNNLNIIFDNMHKISHRIIRQNIQKVQQQHNIFSIGINQLKSLIVIDNSTEECIDNGMAELIALESRLLSSELKDCIDEEKNETKQVYVKSKEQIQKATTEIYMKLNDEYKKCDMDMMCRNITIGKIIYATRKIPIHTTEIVVDVQMFVTESFSRVSRCDFSVVTDLIDLGTKILEESTSCATDLLVY